MIAGFEISKTGRAKCSFCRRVIKEGEPRGFAFNEKYGSKYFYCFKCSEFLIDGWIRDLKTLKEELKDLKKKCSNAIILAELENEE